MILSSILTIARSSHFKSITESIIYTRVFSPYIIYIISEPRNLFTPQLVAFGNLYLSAADICIFHVPATYLIPLTTGLGQLLVYSVVLRCWCSYTVVGISCNHCI